MRDLVDELAQAQARTALAGGDHAPRLGRLVLLDRIGAGAMGTVFAAYDPRLDRKVAVKVLRTTDVADRVLTEARALARLAHPNVVAVYDADELDGLVFIVMELAPGVPLRAWMGGAHPWPEVVRVLREAGNGIAAAHAVGLVHRDIKPDNILVGEDRTRVVDFGLAHTPADDDGTSAGTPFYMAPEVLAGGPASAASDQFSFGVMLFEALYGQRPYELPAATADTVAASAGTPTTPAIPEAPTVPAMADGATLATASPRPRAFHELLADLRRAAEGAVPRPPTTVVPQALHAVVARTLAADPGARFPSMAAVVVALAPRRRRRRVLAIAGAALACGAVLGAIAYRSSAVADPCAGGPSRIAAVWSGGTRAEIRAALGDAAWTEQTLAALAGTAERWQATYRRVCEATRVRGEQSDTLLDLRMRCLDRALDRFGALASAMAAALEPGARVAAPGAVAELPPPEACATLAEAGELAMPSAPGQRALAQAAERALDRAWAAFMLGRYREARAGVATVEVTLSGLAAPRLRAVALLLASSIEGRIGAPADARARLDEALVAAAEAGAPELELDVWERHLRGALFSGDPAKVVEWAPFARASARRAHRTGAEIDGILGEALRAAGKLGPARVLLEHALASPDPLRPEQRAMIEMNLGSVELAAGDSSAALVTFERARARVLAALGEGHPDLALYADKIAAAYRARGRIRDALALHARSIALRTAAFGADDRALATSLLHRAQTRLEAGDVAGANEDATRAGMIRTRVYGADSPRLGEITAVLAEIAHAGRGVALLLYDRAAILDPRLDLTARRSAAGGVLGRAPLVLDRIPPLDPDEVLSVDRAGALAVRVALLATDRRGDEARALATALRARYRSTLDPAFAHAIGSALLAAGDRDGAAELLTAAEAGLGPEPTRTAQRIAELRARAR